MAKLNRVKRPKDELQRELAEQLDLLRHSCRSFDGGLEIVGKHISLSLRVLLHHQGNSRSLLEQLGLRSGRFFDSAGPLNPKNLLTECNLVSMRIGESGADYLPLLAIGLDQRPMRAIQFADWWNNPVMKDKSKRTLCRRELVLNVADTDGGAHVDPELEEAYMAISRENSLNWFVNDGKTLSFPKGRPELACMRQIAHELLCTLQKSAPQFCDAAQPIIPPDAAR